MYTYIHTYIHIHVHTFTLCNRKKVHIHTYIQTHRQTDRHTYTYRHTYMYTYITLRCVRYVAYIVCVRNTYIPTHLYTRIHIAWRLHIQSASFTGGGYISLAVFPRWGQSAPGSINRRYVSRSWSSAWLPDSLQQETMITWRVLTMGGKGDTISAARPWGVGATTDWNSYSKARITAPNTNATNGWQIIPSTKHTWMVVLNRLKRWIGNLIATVHQGDSGNCNYHANWKRLITAVG